MKKPETQRISLEIPTNTGDYWITKKTIIFEPVNDVMLSTINGILQLLEDDRLTNGKRERIINYVLDTVKENINGTQY